jgi:hypothetical protein
MSPLGPGSLQRPRATGEKPPPLPPRYWLDLSEWETEQLATGRVPDAVRQQADRLLQPLTRTDAGVTTPIYTDAPLRFGDEVA